MTSSDNYRLSISSSACGRKRRNMRGAICWRMRQWKFVYCVYLSLGNDYVGGPTYTTHPDNFLANFLRTLSLFPFIIFSRQISSNNFRCNEDVILLRISSRLFRYETGNKGHSERTQWIQIGLQAGWIQCLLSSAWTVLDKCCLRRTRSRDRRDRSYFSPDLNWYRLTNAERKAYITIIAIRLRYNPIQSNEYNGSRPRPLFPSLSKI